MGVYIPNIEKPKSCNECRYKMWTMNETFCNLLDKMLGDEDIRPDCPLIDIVTCGECKWYNPWHANHTNIDGNHCRYIDRPMKPTDFCSYGERRSE